LSDQYDRARTPKGSVTEIIRIVADAVLDSAVCCAHDFGNPCSPLRKLTQDAGDLGQAIPLFKQVLENQLRVLGADHPDTLASRGNLACAYQVAGDLGQAIPLFKQVLEDLLRVLGADHPSTLASRNNLAGAYQDAGDLGQAIPLFERASDDCTRVLGAEHPMSTAYSETLR